jgi:hypothetical protein
VLLKALFNRVASNSSPAKMYHKGLQKSTVECPPDHVLTMHSDLVKVVVLTSNPFQSSDNGQDMSR